MPAPTYVLTTPVRDERRIAYALMVSPGAGAHFLRGWAGEAVRLAPRCPDPEIRRHYGWRRLREAAAGLLGRGRA